jgi:hypothetical protein
MRQVLLLTSRVPGGLLLNAIDTDYPRFVRYFDGGRKTKDGYRWSSVFRLPSFINLDEMYRNARLAIERQIARD